MQKDMMQKESEDTEQGYEITISVSPQGITVGVMSEADEQSQEDQEDPQTAEDPSAEENAENQSSRQVGSLKEALALVTQIYQSQGQMPPDTSSQRKSYYNEA